MKTDNRDVSLDIYTLIQDREQKQEHRQQLRGQLYKKENQTYLRYEEELNGTGQVQNTLKIEDQQVKVIRRGAITMNHLYQLGQITHGIYHSPHGPFEMETKTIQLDYVPIEEGAGKFLLSYELKLNQEHVGLFTLRIEVKE